MKQRCKEPLLVFFLLRHLNLSVSFFFFSFKAVQGRHKALFEIVIPALKN